MKKIVISSIFSGMSTLIKHSAQVFRHFQKPLPPSPIYLRTVRAMPRSKTTTQQNFWAFPNPLWYLKLQKSQVLLRQLQPALMAITVVVESEIVRIIKRPQLLAQTIANPRQRQRGPKARLMFFLQPPKIRTVSHNLPIKVYFFI